MGDRIVVFGGTGFFGRYLVEDLLEHTDATITVASRHTRDWIEQERRVDFAPCDVYAYEAVRTLVEQHDVVIHCAGPFQYLPLNPLIASIEKQRGYVDLSEGREFYRRVAALQPEIDRAGITALTGISIVPALQLLLVEMARPLFDHLIAIRTHLAPGTYRNRGPAMFHTMLMGVGMPFPLWRDGMEVWVRGWSEGEWAQFPPPIGRRLTYHVLDWADSDALRARFGVATIECKAGSEFAWVNRTLCLAGQIRSRLGWPNWERWTTPLRAASWVLGRVGRDDGGVLIEVTGVAEGRCRTHRIALVVAEHGGRIPAVLAAMAAEDLLSKRLTDRGLIPADAWITPEGVAARLRERGMQLLWQAHGTQTWDENLP
jgi:hypothetical protein